MPISQTERRTYRQADGQKTELQTNKRTDRWTNGQTDGQTSGHLQEHSSSISAVTAGAEYIYFIGLETFLIVTHTFLSDK